MQKRKYGRKVLLFILYLLLLVHLTQVQVLRVI